MEKEIKIHPIVHMPRMPYVIFTTWLLWEPLVALCVDSNQLAGGGVTCQHSYFSFQWLVKHGRATKLALEQGAEEPRGPRGLHGAEALVGRASPSLQPGPPAHRHGWGLWTVHRVLGRGKATHHLHLSWFAEHFLRGRSAALLASLGDQGGGLWKWAVLRQPNLHACSITFASIDVEGEKNPQTKQTNQTTKSKNPNQCRRSAGAMHSFTPSLASKDVPGLRGCSSSLERAVWAGGWRSPGQRRFSFFLPQRKYVSVPFPSQHVGGMALRLL